MTDVPPVAGPTAASAYVCNATGVTITSVAIESQVVGRNLAPMSVSAVACSMPGAGFPYPAPPFTTTVVFSNNRTVCRTVQVPAGGSAMVIVAMLNGLLVATADGYAKELLFTSGSADVLLLDAEESAP